MFYQMGEKKYFCDSVYENEKGYTIKQLITFLKKDRIMFIMLSITIRETIEEFIMKNVLVANDPIDALNIYHIKYGSLSEKYRNEIFIKIIKMHSGIKIRILDYFIKKNIPMAVIDHVNIKHIIDIEQNMSLMDQIFKLLECEMERRKIDK